MDEFSGSIGLLAASTDIKLLDGENRAVRNR
jgi:hypothetical protein